MPEPPNFSSFVLLRLNPLFKLAFQKSRVLQLKPFGHLECALMKTSQETSGACRIVILCIADGDPQESQWLPGWLTQQNGEKKWRVHNHPTLASTFHCPCSSHQATWDYSVERFPRHICTTNGRPAPTDGQPKQLLRGGKEGNMLG